MVDLLMEKSRRERLLAPGNIHSSLKTEQVMSIRGLHLFHVLFLSFFCSPPNLFTIFALLFSVPPSRGSDPAPHSRGAFPPPPQYDGSCISYLSREDDFSHSFLASLTRVELRLTPALGALSSSPFTILTDKCNQFTTVKLRTPRTNASGIRG